MHARMIRLYRCIDFNHIIIITKCLVFSSIFFTSYSDIPMLFEYIYMVQILFISIFLFIKSEKRTFYNITFSLYIYNIFYNYIQLTYTGASDAPIQLVFLFTFLHIHLTLIKFQFFSFK